MTDDRIVGIKGPRALEAQFQIIEFADNYDGQSVEVVEATIRHIIAASEQEASAAVPNIARNIVAGRRGSDIYDS